MESLGINAVQLGAQLVNILLLLFVLKKFVYKPLLTMLDSRQKTIEEGLSRANEMQKKEEELQKQGQKITKAANEEAQKIKKQSATEAKKQAGEIIAEAQAEASKIKQEAKKALETDKRVLERKMEDEVVKQATELANRALRELLDADTRAKLTEKQIRNISSQGN